jgi:hypothetical protein
MRWSAVGTICLILSFLTGPSGLAAKKREPVATGTYEILFGGKRIGEERFSVFQEKKKLVVESTATMYWPEPTRHDYAHEIGSSFQTTKLKFDLTRSGVTTSLELESHRDNWRLEIKGEGRKKVRQELGRQADVEIDFGSLLFKSFILKRLGLKPGDERRVEVIALQLPDLGGKRGTQIYRRLEDEEIETKLGKTIKASVYEQVAVSTGRMWVGPSGYVLRARYGLPFLDQFGSPVETFEYNLVQLDSNWPFTPPR